MTIATNERPRSFFVEYYDFMFATARQSSQADGRCGGWKIFFILKRAGDIARMGNSSRKNANWVCHFFHFSCCHIEGQNQLFEVADKGTMFLDEIGDTSLAMQVKLLRVLQERTLRRVGGTEEIPVDVRIIAATNRNLAEMVSDSRFREDLFYRISVIPMELAPLRHRRDDIPLLANHFLARLNASMGKKIDRLSEEALKKIEAYDWPGNVRELENAMERAFILETSNELSPQHLPESVATSSRMRSLTNFPEAGIDLETYVESLQKGFLEEALRRTDGVQVKAAELLRMSYRSFRHYMQKYDIPS
jgi:two-component system response regulator PilR (NtrC family)